MIAGAVGGHTALLHIVQLQHGIAGTPVLEGTRALQIFAFEKEFAAELRIETAASEHRCDQDSIPQTRTRRQHILDVRQRQRIAHVGSFGSKGPALSRLEGTVLFSTPDSQPAVSISLPRSRSCATRMRSSM